MRRAFFGGTFDPPHRGHRDILLALLHDTSVDHVHVLPTGRNPLRANESLGTNEQRLEWVKAWLSTLPKNLARKVVLEDFELQAPASFTIDSLRTLKKRYGRAAKWVLAVGGDALADFHRWKYADQLLVELENVWVFPRVGVAETLEKLDPSLALNSFVLRSEKIAAVSSTNLRSALARGDKLAAEKDLLPAVAKLIL